MAEVFEGTISNIEAMVALYDGGNKPIVFLIATEINSLLTSGAAAKLRGARTFETSTYQPEPGQISGHHPLVSARIGMNPYYVAFIPKFHGGVEPVRHVRFVEWWNRDVIYRCSAQVVNGEFPPPEQRESMTRREFIKLLRDKRGAHPDNEWPALLDNLIAGHDFAGVGNNPGGGWHAPDGTLIPVTASPLGAMVRQIAHEVLVAYGRTDDPPAD